MQYNIILSTDNNYLPYAFVLCQSIVDHLDPSSTESQDELIFHILTDASVDLPIAKSNSEQWLKRNQGHSVAVKFEWHVLSVDDFSSFNHMTRDGKISFSTYYRLIVDKILDSNIDLALYLDIDMLVLSDIRKLFQQYDLSDKVLGAVIDPGVRKYDDKQASCIYAYYKDDASHKIAIPKATYFNAGMLLINLKQWRAQHIGDECLKLASKLNLQYHDQDLLNIVCKDKVDFIELSWNYQGVFFYNLYNPQTDTYDISNLLSKEVHFICHLPSASEFERMSAAPNIIHFTGIKPWATNFSCEMPFSPACPVCPRLSFYLSKWQAISSKVTEFPSCHVLNVDAIELNTLNILKLDRKRKKDRKNLVYLAGASLVFSIVNLILCLCF